MPHIDQPDDRTAVAPLSGLGADSLECSDLLHAFRVRRAEFFSLNPQASMEDFALHLFSEMYEQERFFVALEHAGPMEDWRQS